MTATYDDYTGNNSNKNFTYNFPALLSTDVKVSVDGVTQTSGYTVNTANTRVEFTTAPAQDAKVRVYRETAVGKTSGDEDPKAVFAAGSSVRAADLNNNFEQALFAAHELQDQPILAEDLDTGAVTSAKILDATIVNGDISPNAEIEVSKLKDGTARQVLQTDTNGTGVEWTSNVDVPGTLDVTGAATLDSNITVGSGANISGNTTLGGNLAVTGTTTAAAINASGAVGVDGNLDVNTNKFTVASSTGNTTVAGTLDVTGLSTLASVDINGGAVDGTTIGAASAAAGSFTTVNASGTITGDVTGDLTGNADTATDLAAATKITASEQAAHTVNDTTYFTTAASDAKYYRKGSADDIEESGVPWSGNDSTVATTAAIDKRIIDLVDDVGGFVPIANETSFPAANPDINNPGTGGTIVSVAAASEALPDGNTATLSGSTLTISNGRGTGNAVIITGAPSTIPSGFGFLVETTSTDHTYSFHRLVPKATEVTTVAGKATEIATCHTNISDINTVASDITDISAVAADATDIGAVAAKATEIGRLGTADAVADLALLGTTAVVEDLNLLGTSAAVADMALLGDSAVIADMATIADTSNLITNIGTVAGLDTEITTVAGIQAAVSTTASNSANVNNFASTYQIASSAPSTDGGGNALAAGDLYFDTNASELKVRNAANNAWQGGVTATGNLVAKNGDEFTGNVGIPDGSTSAPSLYNVGDTNTGIYFGAADEVDVTVGGTTKLEVNSDGIDITGNITVSGNVDGKDVSTLTSFANVVEDTTPQLGGNLDVLDKAITTSTGSSQNIVIDPNEGSLVINEKASSGAAQIESESGKAMRIYAGPSNGAYIQLGHGTDGAVHIAPNGSGLTSFGGSSVKLGLGASEYTVTTHQSGAHIKLEPAGTSGNITVKSGANEDIELTPNGTGDVVIDGLKYPQADGSTGEFLKTDGSGQLSWATPANTQLSNAEVKTAVGAASDSNVYTDAEKTKLAAIDDSADVTNATTVNSAGAVMKTIVDAKGDIIVGTAADTYNRLAVGDTDGKVLAVDSSTSTGLTWSTISADGGNAATLDSIDSTSFLRSDAADTATGDITFSGGASAVNIAAASDLRFENGDWAGNTTSPKLQANGNYLYICGGSEGLIFRENDTNRWKIDGSGHHVPAADSTYDIGTDAVRVRNGYFDTLYGDGSNLTGLPGNRNLIINGDCQIDQRQVNYEAYDTNADEQYGGPDRFYQYFYSGSEEARYTFKQAAGPNDKGFDHCAHIDVTTADTSWHADHAIWTGYKVEANDCNGLKWGTSDAVSLTLSFWIKSNVTGTFSLRVCNQNWDERYITTYSISSADTWEKKTITIPGDTRAGKDITVDNSCGIEIKWIWISGSNRVGSTGSWGTGSVEFGASSGGANIFSSTSNYVEITGVQLERGSSATEFEYKRHSDQLAACQRYYWQTNSMYIYATAYSTDHKIAHIYHPVPMRTTPTEDMSTSASFTHYKESEKMFNAYVAHNIDTGGSKFFSQAKFSAEL